MDVDGGEETNPGGGSPGQDRGAPEPRHGRTRRTVRRRLKVRRCPNPACARDRRPYRPEGEGAMALPQHGFGLDRIALVGALRHREHRSVPEVDRAVRDRGVVVCARTVTNRFDRYDELLAVSLADDQRVRTVPAGQGRVVPAHDGRQPDGGHEVLRVGRACLSGAVLPARRLLSATAEDLAALLAAVAGHPAAPIAAVIGDGQTSIRRAGARALPGVAHQLGQFHYLREAARPVDEADRHANKELKKQVRGVRPIERKIAGRDDAEAQVVRGSCAAGRSAITDDGLRPRDRLRAVAAGLDRVAHKGD